MHINRLIERFLREQDFPPTKFGRLAAHDPRLVSDMRLGREMGPALQQRLRQFIMDYRVDKISEKEAV